MVRHDIGCYEGDGNFRNVYEGCLYRKQREGVTKKISQLFSKQVIFRTRTLVNRFEMVICVHTKDGSFADKVNWRN